MGKTRDDTPTAIRKTDGPSTSGPPGPSEPGRTVDAVDRAILRALRDDGRLPVAEVARRASISRANAYSRIERMTASGVIDGYQVRVSPRAIGLEVTALIFLEVEQGRWREIRDDIAAVPEVEFVGMAAGEFDFVVLVRASHTDELRDVVLERFVRMPEVKTSRTVFLLDDFALRPFIP